MTAFGSVNEALDYAIVREEEAARFYTDLAGQMKERQMRKVFEDFAREEMAHKARLLAVKEGRALIHSGSKIADLKIADYAVKITPGDNLNYGEALILAMQREKAAFKLYSDMAAACTDDTTRDLFLALAQEEAKHKLRFELEYDREFLSEN
jgi:rubrerythrin